MRFLALLAIPFCMAQAAPRTVIPFDTGWSFIRSDTPGVEPPGVWHTVRLPHDWSIEGPFDQKNPSGQGGAYLPGGVGWYRKHFTLSAGQLKQRTFIEFDGVMANSDVWVNGAHLGKRPSGYVSFRYELTAHVKAGDNLLTVRADNSQQPASRWDAGAGIYRHVRLILTDPVHLEHWSTFITTPRISATEAAVHVAAGVLNQSEVQHSVALEVTLLGPGGEVAGTAETKPQPIAPGKSAAFEQTLSVAHPELWNLDRPALYHAVVKVRQGRELLDEESVPFGIREFHFDPETGFWLNGKNFKIKGVCLHAGGGAVGTAVPLGVWEHRLEQLKRIGVNAIRTAHNPPAPEFLDLCDRMGFLVMDEMFDCWTVGKNPYDYHLYFRDWSQTDTRDTVRRDRNHPSIILYSAGNEIRDTPNAELARQILRGLVDVFHANDPTRPVTQALFRPNVSHDYEDGLADLLDVVGQNYRENEILAAHRQKPSRKIIGTENQLDRAVWLALRDNPPYSGQFLWAGVDYLGEARAWPAVASSSGLLDKTGGMKPRAYERQSWWSDRPMVHMVRRVAPRPLSPTDPGYEANPRRVVQTLFDDWTPANARPHEETVEVYSNCEEVELMLNGRSLGTKPLPPDASARVWRVPYEPGTLKAVGKNKGEAVAAHELRTAGKPSKIVLAAERKTLRPDWDDVSFVTARVVDEHGTTVPDAANLISFRASGPGVIAATDNADNTSHESYQSPERRAYEGLSVALVKATAAGGTITITASSPGLAAGSVPISTEK